MILNQREVKMNRFILLIIFVFLVNSVLVFCQDPNEPDTIFIQSDLYVEYNPDDGVMVYIDVDFVTDDSIGFVNLPLTWTSSDNLVFPWPVIWRETFLDWDVVWDSLIVNDQLIRIVAWYDCGGQDNPPIFTDGERVNLIDLRFFMSPDAEPQIVMIDSTFDPINGSVIFGDFTGRIEFTPVFYGGWFCYGCIIGVNDTALTIPTEYDLSQNYPNPFNSYTNIKFALPLAGHVNIEIYNILGQKVRELYSEHKEAGYHTVFWDATTNDGGAAPSGIYFYRLQAGDFIESRKMLLLK
jgi:hypothetical protein